MRDAVPRIVRLFADARAPGRATRPRLPAGRGASNLRAPPTLLLPPAPSLLPYSIYIAARSDVGRTRKRNEDAFVVIPERGIAVVADGMGGHPGGDVASRIAADTVAGILEQAIAHDPSAHGFGQLFGSIVDEAVKAAHGEIRNRGTEQPELDKMGTTLTSIVVQPDTGEWVIGHVGDSRAYRVRGGTLDQLTRDDTWVQDQIDRGSMKAENARKSPYAHLLTQCLGLEETPSPQILKGRAESGDIFVLCTDGLVGMLDDDRIADLLSDLRGCDASGDRAEPLDRLLAAANEAGGYDNITVAIVRVD